MKKSIIFLVALICVVSTIQAQISVGIRDNRHIFGEYLLKNHYLFRLEQSVYSEKIGYQTLTVAAAYVSAFKNFDYYGGAYFGGAYNRSYCTAGVNIGLKYTAFNRLMFFGRLNPHYDSELKYETCFSAGAGVIITKNIDVKAAYSTIPEYRMSENRIRGGFDFHVNNLSVSPEISVSVKGADKAKTLRALMGFRYTF